MTNKEFISSINKVENTSRHNEILNQIIESEPNRLFEIFKLIPKDQDYLLKNWQLRSAYERIIKSSSFEIGLENLDITNKVFELCFRSKDQNLIASVLAFKYDSLSLINSLVDSKYNKLAQLVIHELVSRGFDLSRSDYYERIKIINSEGDFKSLPITTSKLEEENDFPSYALNGGGNGISFGFQRSEEFDSIKLPISNDVNFKISKNIKCAIEHWGGESIAYRGEFGKDMKIEQIIRSIPELVGSTKFRIRELKPSKAFSFIFNASSNGSAYTTGYYGAYGRLRSWKTMNSLVSEKELTSILDTEQLVGQYKWYEFNTDHWFINEWLDLGIIGINNNKMEFGLVAATDTD